jgi:aspartate/methionine/tyrosine aminotransferase
MGYSTLEPWQEINEGAVIYNATSLFAYLEKVTDPRQARGKRYQLTTLLVTIILAKLSGQLTPVEMADWAQNHAEGLAQLLKLKRSWMPHHNTLRRVFQNILEEVEFNRLIQGYQQQQCEGGEQLAIDGKTLRGTRLADEEPADLCLHVVCVPGDIVAIESPMYFGTLQSLEVHRLRALEIPTHPREGISLEALRLALEHNPIRAVLTISNFNNPLGSCIPDEKKKELVELLARYQVPLIDNDVSGELYFSDRRPPVTKAFDRQGLVMLCSSFSKDISPALRVGWTAPGRFKATVEWLKFTNSAATATLPQMVVASFLESGGYDHHLRRIRREYDRNVALMSQAVMGCFPPGTRPSGGFVLWVQLPEGIDSLEVYKLALREGITLTPGYIFSPTNQYPDFIRLNAADWSFPNERAITRLGDLVAGMG